jgi:hypothetical protein
MFKDLWRTVLITLAICGVIYFLRTFSGWDQTYITILGGICFIVWTVGKSAADLQGALYERMDELERQNKNLVEKIDSLQWEVERDQPVR